MYRYAGWSACISGIGTVVAFVSAILFFTLGEPFGHINDVFSVVQVAFMLPVVYIMYELYRRDGGVAPVLAAMVGMLGTVAAALGQSLLVFGVITYEQSLTFIPAGGAIGLWLVAIDYRAFKSGLLSRGLGAVGSLAGLSYIVTVAGFLFGGQQNPIFYAGGLLLGVAYPIWALWLAQVFLGSTRQ